MKMEVGLTQKGKLVAEKLLSTAGSYEVAEKAQTKGLFNYAVKKS